MCPTLSRGISRSSAPYLRKTFPAVCWGEMPMPSSVMIAVVAGGTLNSSAANLRTAVNGVLSGTLNLSPEIPRIIMLELPSANHGVLRDLHFEW